jgi:hypothetical protein
MLRWNHTYGGSTKSVHSAVGNAEPQRQIVAGNKGFRGGGFPSTQPSAFTGARNSGLRKYGYPHTLETPAAIEPNYASN